MPRKPRSSLPPCYFHVVNRSAGRSPIFLKRHDYRAFLDVFVASGEGGVTAQSNLAFGPYGQLYVTDWSSGKVHRFDGSTGAYVDDFVTTSSSAASRMAA